MSGLAAHFFVASGSLRTDAGLWREEAVVGRAGQDGAVRLSVDELVEAQPLG